MKSSTWEELKEHMRQRGDESVFGGIKALCDILDARIEKRHLESDKVKPKLCFHGAKTCRECNWVAGFSSEYIRSRREGA